MEHDAEHTPRRDLTDALAGLDGLDRIRDAAGDTPAYLVGGAVRDLLLGDGERSDIDVVVEGDVGPIAERLGGEALRHERFGTAKVTAGELTADLAAARAETYAHPGALPDVTPAALADDLARRDFTVNAMAVPLQGEARLIDPHGGEADLEARRLRVLHDRSFADDPTRAVRAARYAARLGFDLDPRADELVREADLGTVSRTAARRSCYRLACEDSPRRGFELLDEWGLFDASRAGRGADRPRRRAGLGAALERREPSARGRARGGAGRGRARPAPRRAAAREPIRGRRGGARVRAASSWRSARVIGARWLDDYLADWRHVGLEITGEDLIAAGVAEGPALGRGLRAALARKLDGEVAGREAELAAALEASREGPGPA